MPFKNLSSLQLRILSSCVIVPLTLGVIYIGDIFYFMFTTALLFFAFDEWMAMAAKSKRTKLAAALGVFYLGIGLGAFLILRRLEIDYVMMKTMALILMIWATDTGAFFTGKMIGGRKLCPTISPGKTWAGFIGGLMSGALVGYALFVVFGFYNNAQTAVQVGFIVAVASQMGDLLISKYKRHVGIKDTGSLIPGHGGVLDRIDSLLLAAPVYLLCLYILYILQAAQ